MSAIEKFDVVILGSGQGGKQLAWHLGRSGKKVAVVERRWVGGSCPAVACLPSKNELWSARDCSNGAKRRAFRHIDRARQHQHAQDPQAQAGHGRS
ncbi:FAD-dependent oxidoreductase [Bradyrhizobium elkanii]|uniref:FAD-dependent oxidoreductase n=1 Tax=Bradyrhizobium elkanii TaxID=29448 RepID=UPI003514B9E7